MEDLEYFKKKILDHYSELHNSLDIYTETILAKNDFTEEKIQDLNLKRKSLLDQMEMIKKCNLDNLEKNLLENAQILPKYKPAFYKTESDEKKDERDNDEKGDDEEDYDEEDYDEEDYDEEDYEKSYRVKDEIDINEILFKDGFCCYINYEEKSSNRLIFIIWPHYLNGCFLKDIKYVFDNGLYLPLDTLRMLKQTHNFVQIQDILLANLVYYGFKNLERSNDSINIIDFLHTKKISSFEITFPKKKYFTFENELFGPIDDFIRKNDLNDLNFIYFQNISLSLDSLYAKFTNKIDGLDFRNCTIRSNFLSIFEGSRIQTLSFIHCKFSSVNGFFLSGCNNLINFTLNFVNFKRETEKLYKHYQTKKDKFMMEMRFNQMDSNSYLSRNLFVNLFDYNLRSLKIVNLNYNNIRTITKRMFSDLFDLEELFLEENEIDLIEDNSFNGLSNLRKLMLRKNQITKINEFTFKGLTGLVYLNLSDNPIYFTDKEAFRDFINAEIIRE